MKYILCAAALAALLLKPAPAFSEPTRGFDIAQIKAALRITPAQQPYWARVEAVLNEIAQRHEAMHAQANTVQRVHRRVMTIVLDSAAVSRLAEAARPLASVLDDDQKRAAQELARKMGLSQMLAGLR